jgi:hypothetical protein
MVSLGSLLMYASSGFPFYLSGYLYPNALYFRWLNGNGELLALKKVRGSMTIKAK